MLRHDGIDDVLANVRAKLFGRNVVAVLGRNHHRVDAGRLAVHVFDGNLALAVGPEVFQRAGPAHLGKLLAQPVRQLDRQRHQFRGFVAGVAEHEALIARAARIHAHRDIGRLGLHDIQDAARLGIETERRVGVADVGDRLARDCGDVDMRGRRDFAGDYANAGGDEHFAGHARRWVLREHGVENGVGNVVGNFVGVTFGD